MTHQIKWRKVKKKENHSKGIVPSSSIIPPLRSHTHFQILLISNYLSVCVMYHVPLIPPGGGKKVEIKYFWGRSIEACQNNMCRVCENRDKTSGTLIKHHIL